MALTPGTRLGPYEVVASIGSGGMGEVYRARDGRLHRDVAIKTLPQGFADDPGRRARFEREAQAIAALSHPNIVAIFDTGVHNNQAFVVTELLEGETLRARLRSGPLPVRKATDYAVQIARGLAAAHDKGLVHRDLKPENLFLLKDGQIKILDFGLAKDTARIAAPETRDADTATGVTDPAMVLGTVGYMAPEQIRGQAVDARTDLFAFGAVLYEMVSGVRAFQRGTAADTISAILKEDPPELAASDHPVPPGVQRIIRRCLEKEPVERFQSARDLAFGLEAVTGSGADKPAGAREPAVPAPPRHSRATTNLPWLLAGGLLIAVIVLGYALWQKSTAPPAMVRTWRLATGPSGGVYHALGRGLAAVWQQKLPNTQIVVRPTDGAFENMFLLDRGEVDLAFAQNDVAFHTVKTDRVLGSRAANISALSLLYPEPAQIVVSRRANIQTVNDLRRKRIALGLPKSGSRFSSETLLSYFGLQSGDYEARHIDVSSDARSLLDGSLDAAVLWRGIPAPAFEELFKSGQVKLLSLDAASLRGLRVSNPFLVPFTIPAHVYANQDADVSTIAAKAMLVGRRELDDATVGQILNAIFSSIPDLIAHHPRAAEITLSQAFGVDYGLSIDLHPGARKFFDSQPSAKR